MPQAHIGCSGFNYPHWKGVFYPAGLPQRKWLEYYTSLFSTVELNVTFYRLPRAETFVKWHDEAPPDFTFSVKGSRFITHLKRLREPEEHLELFFASATGLAEKMRVVLWQFPPSFSLNPGRLEHFLSLLRGYPVRHTFEFRHQSWITEEVVRLCRDHGAGLCMADMPPFLDELPVTADFVYFRRHGAVRGYNYSDEALGRDAERIRDHLQQGRDVYCYFNNDAYGCAPRNARTLTGMLT
ncbi:MAG: DUF72 domain-containing protein [Thermodesulfovibrionales bacterium]